MISQIYPKYPSFSRFPFLSRLQLRNASKGVSFLRSQTSLAAATSSQQVPSVGRPFEEIPGPRGVPFFGTVHNYLTEKARKQPFVVHQGFFKKYGPIFKENLFGRDIVHISDLDEAGKVFRSEGKYPNRPGFESVAEIRKSKNEPIGIVNMQGEEWHKIRQAIAPRMLRPREIHENIDNFNSVVKDTMKRLTTVRETYGQGGEVPDLQRELFKWSTESIGTMVFDVRLGLYDDPPAEDVLAFIQAVNDFFIYAHKVEVGYERTFVKFVETPSLKKVQQAINIMSDVGRKHIDKQIKQLSEKLHSSDKKQVVPLLSYLTTKENLTLNEVIVITIDILTAGVDTTSTTMSWLLYYLARNPETQDRLLEEVNKLLGRDEYLTKEDLNKIPYLKACLKETMRLSTVASSIVRILSQEIELLGYRVPAGTMIQIPTYSIGRSEKYFKDPLTFKPDRWLRETQGEDAAARAFGKLPFGFGPRMCVGKRLAEMEIYLLLAKVIQRFRLEYHHEPVEPVMRLLTYPDRPIKIKFIDRE